MTEGGGGVDELEGDDFAGGTVGDRSDGLSEGDGSSLNTRAGTTDHDVVLVNNTVVRVSSHGGDLLSGKIVLSLDFSRLSNLVDLLVDFSSVVVSVLTSASNAEADTRWMPSTNTSDLAETLVSLSGKAGGSPTGGYTLESLTLGGGKSIDQLVFTEDRVNADLLLKKRLSELDLISSRSTVDLDLHDVGSLLSNLKETDLSVSNNSDDRAVLGDLLEFSVDALLTIISGVLLGVLGEGLLLGAVPVLVEASEELLAQVLGPDGGKGTETSGGGDISYNTDNEHGGSLEDGDSLNDFLLVELSSRAVNLTNNLVHASLVSHEGSKMRRGGSVVTRELSDCSLLAMSSIISLLTLSSVLLGSLTGQESERTVTRVFKFTMGHRARLTGRRTRK